MSEETVQLFVNGKLNEEWIKNLENHDGNTVKIRAFYLAGARMKDTVECHRASCICKTKKAMYVDPVTKESEAQPMMLCYFCNRTYHLKCIGLDLRKVGEESTPWICTGCMSGSDRDIMKKYLEETGYRISLTERRKLLLKDLSSETNYEIDAPYDVLDLTAFNMQENDVADDPDAASRRAMVEDDRRRRTRQRSRAPALDEEGILLERTLNAELLMNMQTQINKLSEMFKAATTSNAIIGQSTEGARASRSSDVTQNASRVYEGMRGQPQSERLSRQDMPRRSDAGGSNSQQTPHSHSREKRSSSRPQSASRSSTINVSQSAQNGEQTFVDLMARWANSQERMETDKLLAAKRKAMPKIVEFNGDSMKWLEFEKDVERYRTVCRYDDETIKIHLRGALKGEAFDCVGDVFDVFDLEQIMSLLRETFGDAMVMIKRRVRELKEFKVQGIMYCEDVVKVKIAIQSYFAACTYGGTGCLNSNELGELLYSQLGAEDKLRVKEMYIRKNPGERIVMNLNTIYEYLTERLPLLDEKPKKEREKDRAVEKKDDKKSGRSYQVQSTSSGTQNENCDIFTINDRNKTPDGYDLQKLESIPKKCEICSKQGHYSVQCFELRNLSEDQRMKLIMEKRLCRNCLISTQQVASQCDLKLGCGLTVTENFRCTRKHHAAIHNVAATNFNQRSNGFSRRGRREGMRDNARGSRENLEKLKDQQVNASTSTDTPQVSQQQQASANQSVGFHSNVPPQRVYVMNQALTTTHSKLVSATSFQHTVKMFKTVFFGPNGHTVAFAVGDSAAEMTLVRNDLREQLGIKGEKVRISLCWSDNTVKESDAVKFDMTVCALIEKNVIFRY